METIKSLQRELNLSERFIRKLIAQHRIRVLRFGRAIRIPEEEADRVKKEGVTR